MGEGMGFGKQQPIRTRDKEQKRALFGPITNKKK